MKDHNYWQMQLNRFVDYELGPADHEALEVRLKECRDCKVQSEFLQTMKKRLKAHREIVQFPDSVKNEYWNK